MNILVTIGVLFVLSFGVVIFMVFRGGSNGDAQPPTTQPPPTQLDYHRSNQPTTVEESLDTLEDFCGITEADRRQKVCSRLARINATANPNDMENTTRTTTKKGTQS